MREAGRACADARWAGPLALRRGGACAPRARAPVSPRALLLWGGSRKALCFAAWREYAARRGAKARGLARALAHWGGSYHTRVGARARVCARVPTAARRAARRLHRRRARQMV